MSHSATHETRFLCRENSVRRNPEFLSGFCRPSLRSTSITAFIAMCLICASILSAQPPENDRTEVKAPGSAPDAETPATKPKSSGPNATGPYTAKTTSPIAEENRVSLEVARDRARLMQKIYEATLHTMHDRYFHADRAVIPARAMEDVFEQMEEASQSKARWISASLSPMSINHEPETTFEKDAARQIARGEECVETIEDGYYRRVGSIPMTGGCVSCHAGFSTKQSASPKFSGLVISIPVKADVTREMLTTP